MAKAQDTGSGLFYIATMKPVDAEDRRRITRHRCERDGFGFTTIEQPVDIEAILDKCGSKGSFLLDSVTALLSNEMFTADGDVREGYAGKTKRGIKTIIDGVSDIVIVSDFIYSDAIIYSPLTEGYRKALAEIDMSAARSCDVVLEAAYSGLVFHKGKDIFGRLNEKML